MEGEEGHRLWLLAQEIGRGDLGGKVPALGHPVEQIHLIHAEPISLGPEWSRLSDQQHHGCERHAIPEVIPSPAKPLRTNRGEGD